MPRNLRLWRGIWHRERRPSSRSTLLTPKCRLPVWNGRVAWGSWSAKIGTLHGLVTRPPGGVRRSLQTPGSRYDWLACSGGGWWDHRWCVRLSCLRRQSAADGGGGAVPSSISLNVGSSCCCVSARWYCVRIRESTLAVAERRLPGGLAGSSWSQRWNCACGDEARQVCTKTCLLQCVRGQTN